MPVIRQFVSISQLADLLGVATERLLDIEFDRRTSTACLVLEPDAIWAAAHGAPGEPATGVSPLKHAAAHS